VSRKQLVWLYGKFPIFKSSNFQIKMAKLNFGGVEENVVTREEFPLEKHRKF
jgi:hypothetical protein